MSAVPGPARVTLLAGAGRFHGPDEGSTHCVEHLRSDHLSVGTYSISAGGSDSQVPHTEDEVYVITTGRARLSTPSAETDVGPGDAVFVAAGEPHTFVRISGDFATLVLFAPPETEPR